MSDSTQNRALRRYLVRRFWASALGFWRRNGEATAWLLSGGLMLVILVQLAIQYGLNLWNRAIFDAFEQHQAETVYRQVGIFPLLVVANVVAGVSVVYVRMTIARRWRRWLTKHILDRWLTDGRFYQLNLIRGDHANPEYRVSDDLRLATESPVDFATGLIAAALSAATFIVVLWTIGGSITLQLAGRDITVPGFLVVAAVVYAFVASGSMVVIGRRFVAVAEQKNQAEAEYRYTLTRVRENGESIALLGGDQEEHDGVDRALANVLARWRAICVQNMRTAVVSQGSAIIAPVVPIILSAPKFLDGTMSLGQVMQAASAFVTVQAAFNWLVENYPRFADWTASARRVAALLVSLDRLERLAKRKEGRITRRETEGAALVLRNVSVTLDDGTQVVDDAEVSIAPGERVLVAGESGTGKSTLVRAIAGLWPWGDGDIAVRSGAKLFMLPQRPYVPIGSLRRATTYPTAADDVDRDQVVHALELVGLGHFVERLDEEAAWDQILSGGEKQRLAFARLFIHRPDIVIMDEATSALDPPSQERMMHLVAEELEATTIVSVGHRPELEAFHGRKLTLESRENGARLVRDEDLDSKLSAGGIFRWLESRIGPPEEAPKAGDEP